MMTCCFRIGLATVLAVVLVSGADAANRLPESGRPPHSEAAADWGTNLGNDQGHRFSALAQINKGNVASLVPRYSVPLGGIVEGAGNFSAALPISPLVRDGYLYIVDGWGAVYKLDLRRDGAVVWRSTANQHNLDAWLEASRGLALAGSSVLSISADGRLSWIDDASGQITRSVQIGDPIEGYTIAAPPLVVGDTIIVGSSGVRRGPRAQIDALDAVSGKPLWRTYPGEQSLLGGSFLQTATLDPDRATAYLGAVDAAPFEDDGLPRFGNAVLAVDIRTGAIRWTYHYASSPQGGFAEAAPYQVVSSPDGGPPVLLHFGNDGRFYVFDTQHPEQPLTAAYLSDVESSSPGTLPDLGDGLTVLGSTDALWMGQPDCPNVRNAAGFASTYSPKTLLSYGASADGCHTGGKVVKTYSIGRWLGAYYAGADDTLGLLSAIEPQTGRVVAQQLFDFPLQSGAVATAGGLVFTTTADGTFYALDDETLAPLWSTKLGSLSSVPPLSFSVDGEQFVAVVVGGNRFDDELPYQPKELSLTEDLFVLTVFGLPR